jgi:hypothetical protein
MPNPPPQEDSIGQQFPVLDILSATRLVVGAGTDDGISSKTQFFVFGFGDLLHDREGREYEPLEIIRGYARVIHVQKTICTVESTSTMQKAVPSRGYYSAIIGETPPSEFKIVTRPFEGVQIGDLARVIS